MLNMALFDYAINEKCYSVYGGRGICPLFSSPPRGIWQLKSPHPREFAIQGKKNANAKGSVQGGTGHSWNWLMHYRRGLQTDYNKKNLYQAEKPSPSEPRNHQTLTWTNLSDDEPVPCKRDNSDQSILVLQKLWLETMTMKVSMQKKPKDTLDCSKLYNIREWELHISPPDHPQITFQRSMTHKACVACGPKTTDFSRFPEKRHSTKSSVVGFVTKLNAKHNRKNP